MKQRPYDVPTKILSSPMDFEKTQQLHGECKDDQPNTPTANSASSILHRDATDEEIAALPHIAGHIPLAAWIAICAGASERFTYYAIITPWRKHRFPFST